jgi:hypothetical protein
MNMFVDPSSIKQEKDVYKKLYNIYKKYKNQKINTIKQYINENENIPQKIIYGFQVR